MATCYETKHHEITCGRCQKKVYVVGNAKYCIFCRDIVQSEKKSISQIMRRKKYQTLTECVE